MSEVEPAKLLALDIESSRLKAVVVGTDGTIVEESSRATPTEAPGADRAEIKLETLWQEIAATVAGLGLSRLGIRALGTAAQLGTVITDRGGVPLMPAMLWADRRAVAEAEELSETIPQASRATSGRPMAPELVGPRVRWLQRNHPAVWARAGRVMSLKDWVVARLTGAFFTDETHASYSGLFDVARREWSRRLAAAAGVDIGLLPSSRPAIAPAGRLTAEAAATLGLSADGIVSVGASDGTAGTVGAGAIRAGVTVDVAGTTDVVLATTSEPVTDPGGAAVLNAHALPGLWSVGGPTGLTGGAVEWMAKTLGFVSVEAAKSALAVQLALVPPGSRGLAFFPGLGGSRFPRWRPEERGIISGLEVRHEPADLLRAAEEGANFIVREALLALGPCGVDLKEITVVGGLASDPDALQLRADAFGFPVRTTQISEASAVGTAIFAAVAAGLFPSAIAAASAMIADGRSFTPDAQRHAALAAAFTRWRHVGAAA
jgi:sugar (pentulose or hexulose) kinase